MYNFTIRKSTIHEQFRVARCALMERINDGGKFLIQLKSSDTIISFYIDDSEDGENFFLNIRPDKVEQFMNGEIYSVIMYLTILILI